MGRKTASITIDAEGRDKGKTFLFTEAPATQAEKWALKLLLAAGRSGAEIPDDIADAGMAAIPLLTLKAVSGLAWYDAEPLLDEMFTCVQRVEELVTRPLVEDDIEEVLTRIKLREEVLSLHLGFSLRAWLSMLISAMRSVARANMSMSQEPSEPSSQAD